MEGSVDLNKTIELESKTRAKYTNLTKLLFLIGIVLIIWVFVVFAGVFLWGFDATWAGIGFDIWVYIFAIIAGIFILLEILFYYRYLGLRNKVVEIKKPKVEYLEGKRVYVYTHPKGVEGGVFSKTYVQMDEHNILRLRSLMVSPGELWKKTEKKAEE